MNACCALDRRFVLEPVVWNGCVCSVSCPGFVQDLALGRVLRSRHFIANAQAEERNMSYALAVPTKFLQGCDANTPALRNLMH